MAKISVIGAGIAGIWQAFILQTRGHRVSLWDPSGAPSSVAASRLAGAMLAPYCEGEAGHEDVRELGLESVALWREFYPATTMSGTLVVAGARDQADLRRFSGVTIGHSTMDADGIAALEPALAERFAAGLHYADEGFVEPPAAMVWLIEQAKAHGAEVLLRPYDGKIDKAEIVIDCRGIAAKDHLKTLRGVRGERMLVDCPGLKLSRPVRLLHPRVAFYIVPWAGARFMIGATVIESEDESPASLRSSLELMSAAYALTPALAEARIVEIASGVRPAFADNMPKILVKGRHIHVNGFYRHGFLLSPLLAKLTADYIDKGEWREGVVFEDQGEW